VGRIRGARGFPALHFTQRAMSSVALGNTTPAGDVGKQPSHALLSLALTRTADTDAIPAMCDAY
jgi:hypothetical protein